MSTVALTFTQDATTGEYVAEQLAVVGDFNLHVETENAGKIVVRQRTPQDTGVTLEYADNAWWKKTDVIDVNFHGIGMTTDIQVACSEEPVDGHNFLTQ